VSDRHPALAVPPITPDIRLLHVDDLDPVRTLSHRIAHRLCELSVRLVDPIDRESIRFLARGDEIMSARINIDAARLSLGAEIGDVSPQFQ
jgi:hypothetical protein